MTTFTDYTLDEVDEKIVTMDGIIEILLHWQQHCPQRMARLCWYSTDFANHIWRLAQVSEARLEAEAAAAAAWREGGKDD